MFSYSFGSLAKARRSAAAACDLSQAMSADPKVNRAALLAKYDVVADVASDAVFLRPQRGVRRKVGK